MVSKELKINDLVWAKMKGFPHWPGKIAPPDANSKPKKNHHYVYFFGSMNYAWIGDEFIEPHSEKMVQKYGQRKGEIFQKAVQTIIEQSKKAPKHDIVVESVDSASKMSQDDKKSDSKSVSKTKSLSKNDSSAQKIKKKVSVKKATSTKTASQEKKLLNKRAHSPDQKESESYSTGTMSHTIHSYESSVLTYSIEKKTTSINRMAKKRIRSSVTPMTDLKQKSPSVEEKKIKPTRKIIGFLGLNHIGQGVVNNLHKTGHTLIVWNTTEEESEMFAEKVKIAATPGEVAKSADIIFSCMSNPKSAKEIIEGNSGVLAGLEQSKASKSYIEMSSMDPKISEAIETEIKEKGGHFLEAPVYGSRIEANEGTLLILAAGDKTVYDECKSCFDAISSRHTFISAEVGSASKLNIIHNMLAGTVYAGIGETLALVKQLGLSGTMFQDIFQKITLFNSNILNSLTSMVNRDLNSLTSTVNRNFVPVNMPLNQIEEEFNIGLSIGQELAQRSTVFSYSSNVFRRSKMLKFADYDASAVVEGFNARERTNEELKEK